MNILVGTDYYYPSVGGQQIVLKEISERLVILGHNVTVATTFMIDRTETMYNGVYIKEFKIGGSYVHGLTGKVKDYQNYILTSNFDAILIKAAQGWTIDALIPILDKIKTRKIFIPCGFSALYNKYYTEYYKLMPKMLRNIDHLILFGSDYRDINFAKENNINNFTIIPNGASEVEFGVAKDDSFRDRLNIDKSDFLILTVGTFTGGKGQDEVAEAFKKANFKISTTLILNGNQPSILLSKKVSVKIKKYIKLSPRTLIKHIIHDLKQLIKPNKKIVQNWDTISQEVNSKNDNKKILITNLDRPDVVQAYLNADLFVFASNIEYSPLVLFESAAAGLPFLTVPVGNSEEIIKWTEGGILCPAQINDNGRTIVDTNVLAEKILELANNLNHRKKLGVQGKYNWQKRFSWEKITLEYEKILKGNFN